MTDAAGEPVVGAVAVGDEGELAVGDGADVRVAPDVGVAAVDPPPQPVRAVPRTTAANHAPKGLCPVCRWRNDGSNLLSSHIEADAIGI